MNMVLYPQIEMVRGLDDGGPVRGKPTLLQDRSLP
jgi:hypothetical protein